MTIVDRKQMVYTGLLNLLIMAVLCEVHCMSIPIAVCPSGRRVVCLSVECGDRPGCNSACHFFSFDSFSFFWRHKC